MEPLRPDSPRPPQSFPPEDQRAKLTADIDQVAQPAKVLKAFDLYLKSYDQHRTNVWTASALIFTSSAAVVGLVQAAFSVAQACTAGADGSTVHTCGLAAANIVAACVGIGGATVSTKLLVAARSNVQGVTNNLDRELSTKLKKKPGMINRVNEYGLELVSRFAELSKQDQRNIRTYLASKTDELIEP